jgi:hypothetical protein
MGGRRRVKEPASGPPRIGPFDRWQTLLAAVVAALASIVVAVITTWDGGNGGPPLARQTPETPILTISTLSEQPEPPPPTARRYVFIGTAHLRSGESIFVLARAATPPAAPRKGLGGTAVAGIASREGDIRRPLDRQLAPGDASDRGELDRCDHLRARAVPPVSGEPSSSPTRGPGAPGPLEKLAVAGPCASEVRAAIAITTASSSRPACI